MIIIKIGFVGGGKVGFSLGKYLTVNNIKVEGYYSKSVDSRDRAAKFTDSKSFESLKELALNCDIIFITTTDSNIPLVWEELKSISIKNKIVCHCSGSLSSDVFTDREDYNIYGYSVHPLFPVSNKFETYKLLKDAFIAIEGDLEKLDSIKDIFISLGNKVQVMNKENKTLYHASAVISSNLVLGVINNAIKNLERCGFSKKDAYEALYPLMSTNINNGRNFGIVDALTGPVERGDVTTVLKHLEVLDKEQIEMYKLLSKELLEISKEKNGDKDYKEMEELLWN